MTDLKPCPCGATPVFCGKLPGKEDTLGCGARCNRIVCVACRSETIFYDLLEEPANYTEAARRWNTRPTQEGEE